MRRCRSFLIIVIFLICSFSNILFSACNGTHEPKTETEIIKASIIKGKELATSYCQSCHQFPDPSLLDKESWQKGVLPHMGPLLGIYESNYQRYPANINDVNLPKGFYPAKPVLKPEEWQNIIDYYVASSPDSLRLLQRELPVANHLSLFTAHIPAIKYDNPSTSFVKIIQGKSSHQLIICDLFKQNIYRFNKKLNILDSMFSSGAIVDIDFQHKGMLTCNIGTFNPTNSKYGEGRYIRTNPNGKFKKDTAALFNNLTRPVQITACDVDKDGRTDYVVSEFGYLTGALSWMHNIDGRFERRVIRPVAGAVRTYIEDYNKDGLPDIWALFAQGEEGIFLFTNKGNGQFEQKQILRFPPSFGSSYFEFADINKDGLPDIVYTCGDNADYSTVLKPYHGVYIFINTGNNRFKQQYFFHIDGCYKAIARDYDNDGDVDIATIAYFADYNKQPREGFVYLENEGNFVYKPFTVKEAQQGRWITMDAGDLDGDGDTDLVLGNFATGPTMMKTHRDWKKGPPFILLENTGRSTRKQLK